MLRPVWARQRNRLSGPIRNPFRGLARKPEGPDRFREESHKLREQVAESLRTARDSATKVAEDIKDMTGKVAGKAKEQASQAMRATKEVLTGHAAKDETEAPSVTDKLQQAKDETEAPSVTGEFQQAKKAASEMASNVAEEIKQGAKQARDAAEPVKDPTEMCGESEAIEERVIRNSPKAEAELMKKGKELQHGDQEKNQM